MIGDFRGKTAFITGGASGIGFAMARAFGRAGMNVVVADIDLGAAKAAVDRLASFRGVRLIEPEWLRLGRRDQQAKLLLPARRLARRQLAPGRC